MKEVYGFEYYKPSLDLIEIIMPEIKKEFRQMKREMKREKYPFFALFFSGLMHNPEEDPKYLLEGILGGIKFCFFGPEKKGVQYTVGEAVNNAMIQSWARNENAKINDYIPIIQNEKFVPDFLISLKSRIDRNRKFPQLFYDSIPKEMLDYYSLKKREEGIFDILVSPEKKDLSLLVKIIHQVPSIEDIEKDDKWTTTV